MKRHDKHFVYILKCRDGTYYTGYSNNPTKRVESHNQGYGAKYLRGKLPAEIVYPKKYCYYKNALRAERGIKKLTRLQKEELIQNFSKKYSDKLQSKVNSIKSRRGDTHVQVSRKIKNSS